MLSQKELLYDEMYFASKDELNDPLEMILLFELLDKDGNIWPQLLDRVLTDINPQNNTEYVKYAIEYLKSKTLNYEDLLNNFCTHKKAIIQLTSQSKSKSKSSYESELTSLLDNLKLFLSRHKPNSGYSVSFSESNDDMLMWSHYSSAHKGYCLIFRPIKEHLSQCLSREKTKLTSSETSISIGFKEFKFESMIYDDTVKQIDAFKLFGSAYTGYPTHSDAMLRKNNHDILAQRLTKHKCWDYERERRLLLPLPENMLGGEEPCFTSTQRLFYYDFSQVKGIIFGARMPKKERDTIKEIIQSKLGCDLNSRLKRHADFLYQEAKICSLSRELKIIDLDLISDGETVAKDSDDYDKKLAKWNKQK